MTKRKAKPAPEIPGPPVVAEDLADFTLAICPRCDGFGGVVRDETWHVCPDCVGGGRIRKTVQP
jgi:hypothetical protein